MREHRNDDKMDALEARIDRLDAKAGAPAAKVHDIDLRLARVEVRVEVRFKWVDERLEKLDAELLEQRWK